MYSKKTFLTIIGVIVLLITGVSVYLYTSGPKADKNQNTSDVEKVVNNPQKGDAGYVEENKTLRQTNSHKLMGPLVSIDSGAVTIFNEGRELTYSLNEGELAVQCTKQSLQGATSADIGLVEEVKVVDPGSLQGKLSPNTPVFLVGIDNDGIVTVHTMFVPVAACASI
jgi:hypothetical protein